MENKGKAFVSLAFALVALLVLAPIVGAQGEPPDTAKPPSINKVVDDTRLMLGDSVRFTIVAINRAAPTRTVPGPTFGSQSTSIQRCASMPPPVRRAL